MRYQQLIEATASRAGLEDQEQAARLMQATLDALDEALPRLVAAAVGAQLPPELRGRLGHSTFSPPASLDDLITRIRSLAEMPGAAPGELLEAATVVCQLVAETLDEGTLGHLQQNLPEPLIPLFAPAPPAPAVPRAVRQSKTQEPRRGQRQTLAEGRPASQHPLSEATVPGAQAHSVAREDNPHQESKISSGALSGEREGRTLAEGAAGSEKPLSEGREG